MKITTVLIGEHGVLRAMFTHVLATVPRLDNAGEVRALAELVSTALLTHAALEDELVFPAIEARTGPIGPIVVMRDEHHEIDEALEAAVAARTRDEIARFLLDAIHTAIPHFDKEEAILFPLAEDTIAPAELARLARVWAATRGVGSARD